MTKTLQLWFMGCLAALTLADKATAASNYALSNAFFGLVFTNPVCIASPPGETNRLFVVERKGRIAVITNLAAPSRTIFLDISGSVTSAADTSTDDEQGLLGLAFHPGFASNGFFYVFYTGPATTTAGGGLHDILSRFLISGANTNQGDPASETRYVVQRDEANNHNAGDLHFGPDGYLYVSLGDEGGAYGNFLNTQRIDRDFFSAIVRIDVDFKAGSLPPNAHASALPSLTNYAIPPDNPYVGATSFNGSPVNTTNVRTEFWAVGMRNPWRFCFDDLDGTLYLGHVGQGTVEWINILTNGANCGWNYFEGNKQWTNTLPADFVRTPPLFEYGHTNSRNCIIGGVVYHGSSIGSLNGAYIYSDHGSGEIWALRRSGTTVTQNLALLTNSSTKINAFGVNPANGDVLCAAARTGITSTIEKIIYTGPPAPTPRITEITLSGSELVIHGTSGTANQSFSVLASSNLTLPTTSWPSIASGLCDASGNFAVTNVVDPNLPQSFYRVQTP